MKKVNGKVVSVSGSLVGAHVPDGAVMNGEVAFITTEEGIRLKSEVIDVKPGDIAFLQVFEDTLWTKVGDLVEFTGKPLSVTLGPGILGSVTDGLQNPLYKLAEKEWFLERGLVVPSLDTERLWNFRPWVQSGDTITGGSVLGVVKENLFPHKIFVPFNIRENLVVEFVREDGEYTVDTVVAIARDSKGEKQEFSMQFEWPVKVPMDFHRRTVPDKPMHTGIRIIDALFPIAYGGTACNPGPFGAGKTVLQHSLAKHTQADVIIIAACGERAGEAVEVFRDFPELVDPKSGSSLMDRTYIVGNTSSMPVAAREASVYISATVGEYYRKQGLHVLMLADSTSRWAQAMREISGRKEEIPGPEAFPMYISTLISALYDRAGVEELEDGSKGSLSIIGTVSPAGGNFDEPVTQATLMSTGAFWALSRARSDARKYPAIDPEESNSRYPSELNHERVLDLLSLMNERKKIASNLILMGEKGITHEAFVLYQKGELADSVFLQQNSFHEVDGVTNPERLHLMFDVLQEVLEHPVSLKDKEQIRSHFNYIRQAFLDWNYTPVDHPDFDVQLERIREIVKQQMYATEDL